MKYTYLEDLIDETKKDNKLKSDMISAVYSRARYEINKQVRTKDYDDFNYEGTLVQSDDLLYDCIHPKLRKLMHKIDQAITIAVNIDAREIQEFNSDKGVILEAIEHIGSLVIWDNPSGTFLSKFDDDELCKLFNTKIDEICKLCEEIKH